MVGAVNGCVQHSSILLLLLLLSSSSSSASFVCLLGVFQLLITLEKTLTSLGKILLPQNEFNTDPCHSISDYLCFFLGLELLLLYFFILLFPPLLLFFLFIGFCAFVMFFVSLCWLYNRELRY